MQLFPGTFTVTVMVNQCLLTAQIGRLDWLGSNVGLLTSDMAVNWTLD